MMRRSFLALSSILVLAAPLASAQPAPQRVERGQLILENVPDTPAPIRERLRQYVNTRGAGFQDFLPDGSILITTRFGDAAQVHRVRAPMGMREQLTFYGEPVGGAGVRPNANQFLFAKDTGGDEQFQGYLFDVATGAVTQFTDPAMRHQSFTFSSDGKRIAFSRLEKASRDYDVIVADPGDPKSARVALEGTGAIGPIDWSPDGRTLLLGESVSIAKSKRFLMDIDSGKLTELTPDLNVAYDGGEFTPDGKSLIMVSDEGSEFAQLIRLDLSTQARTVLTPGLSWDVESFDLSDDGRSIAYTINANGASELRLLDARNGRALPAPKLPPGVVFGLTFDDSGSRLGFTLNSATSPSDSYVYNLRSRQLVRWTQSEIGGLDASRFVEPQLVSFPTFDSATGGPKEITAWVYAPRTPGPHPAIVSIHGGPEAQSRPTFSSTVQYWVNELGVAVILPNVRGSTGYGKTFVSLDNGFKREDSVKDIGALLDWMGAQPQRFDMKRVLAYGGSYGGYMVYASMIMFPERWAGGVDIVGISDFVTFLENTSGYRRDLRRVEYGDERDPAMRAHLQKISPLKNASRIRKPMFIIHGANDPRVPVSEAEQMLSAIRANNVDAWLMIAKDEGHGFAKKTNQEAQREAETLFISKVLTPSGGR
jgi:dipeptidyl aminopeptidase/acylaminoacyl peptidase